MNRRELLRHPGLLALLAREVVSTAGSQMTWVALPWFVLTTTGSATRMTAVIAVEAAALGIFGFAAGNLAARLGPRRTLLVADACRAPLMALIPALHVAGVLSFPLLLALVFVFGSFGTSAFASKQALLPDLVGEDEGALSEANALLQAANRVAMILGPALAGVLIGLVGATTVLYVDAATFVVGFVLVGLFVRAAGTVEDAAPSGLAAGIRFLLGDRLLRPWSLAVVVSDIGWLALFAAMPVLVLTRFGEEPALVGWIFGGFGAGAVLGSAVAFRFVRRVDRLLVGSLGEPAMVAPLWLFVLDAPAGVLVAAMVLAGLANGVVNAPIHTIFQLRTPRALRAKAWAAIVAATALLTPLALVGTGPSLDRYGVDATLVAILAVQSAASLAFALAGLRERARGLRALPAEAAL